MFPTKYNFITSGKKGDLIMTLYIVKAMGGGNVFVTKGEFEEPLESVLESCGKLVSSQNYISSFNIHKGEPIDVNLDQFRKSKSLYRTTLLDVMSRSHRLTLNEPVYGWIDVPADHRFSDKIVIHRRTSKTVRIPNPLFNWKKLIDVLGKKNIVFVSRLEDEWKEFDDVQVEYYRPYDNYEHACILKGCNLYIGNQSFPSALADAVGTNRIFELCHKLDRKHFAIQYSPNAWYFATPWDCTIKNFRYLKKRESGYIDLVTRKHVKSYEESYRFNWLLAFKCEMNFRKDYYTGLMKRLIKYLGGLL